MNSKGSLYGIRALVTRPEEQAEQLAEAIRSEGGEAWVLPMLEIIPLAETQPMRDTVLALDQFSKVIVISKHAARYGLELVDSYWPQLPVALDWFAIGNSTRSTLQSFDIGAVCPEIGSDSEALLELPAFQQVSGEKILILKGAGGRDLLESTLTGRGALVESLEVYRRQRPYYQPGHAARLIDRNRVNVILAGSGETVNHLEHYLSSSSAMQLSEQILKNCLLAVPSERVARQSRSLGFTRICTAEGASNTAMLSALNSINSEEPS